MDPIQKCAMIYGLIHAVAWPFFLGYHTKHISVGNNDRFSVPLPLVIILCALHTGLTFPVLGRVIWGL